MHEIVKKKIGSLFHGRLASGWSRPTPSPYFLFLTPPLPRCPRLYRNLTIEQAELLEGHFNAVPVPVTPPTVATVADTATSAGGEGGTAPNINGDSKADSDGGGERQRIAAAVKASPPLARRVKVSHWLTSPDG